MLKQSTEEVLQFLYGTKQYLERLAHTKRETPHSNAGSNSDR
jgi:hypothetical protein